MLPTALTDRPFLLWASHHGRMVCAATLFVRERPGISDVTVLELIIVPDRSGGAARASLASLRLA